MFFGDEVDLGAVGGHADIFDFGRFVGGRIFGDLVGDGVVNAHVELHQAGATRASVTCAARSFVRQSFEKHLSAGKAHQDVGAVGRHTLIIIGWTICGGLAGAPGKGCYHAGFRWNSRVPVGSLRRLEARR